MQSVIAPTVPKSVSPPKAMVPYAALPCRTTVPGVDPEHREVIFQPFKRLVGRGVEGTGLGLAICRRIAQLHGGAIWCEGKEPVGSTFIVELPLARPAATASTTVPDGQGAKAVPPAEGSSRLAEVLLVEDSPADVQLLKIKLMQRAKVSFNLHVAANGRDAMRLLQERATADGEPGIDLMLLDINMPIMDGFEVLDALSTDTQLKSIPVCILSTSSDEDDMQRAKSLGASAYMIKPPTLQQFREVLDGLDHFGFAAARRWPSTLCGTFEANSNYDGMTFILALILALTTPSKPSGLYSMVSGIHHVTLITRKVQANVDFYAGFLGMRLVKQTAGFEDATQLHLFYGDTVGSPGSLVTFLVWEDGSPGRVGHGQIGELSLAIDPPASVTGSPAA